MLEPYVLGEHWHVPSGFRREHPFVAAMEGASLINATYPHISVSGFLSSHAYATTHGCNEPHSRSRCLHI
jgi:hypothetical protein